MGRGLRRYEDGGLPAFYRSRREPASGDQTGSNVPVTVAFPGEASHRIEEAIASGRVHLEVSAPGMAARLAGVSMVSGRTALAKIPSARHSAARESVRPARADLAET